MSLRTECAIHSCFRIVRLEEARGKSFTNKKILFANEPVVLF
ncbi:17906_t:CDS:1, partial [Acaulospora morrowiae]